MEIGVYHIAATLGMTVADLTSRLTWSEYLGWVEYFAQLSGKAEEPGHGPILDKPNMLASPDAFVAGLRSSP